MGLEDIMLSKMSHTEKEKYCMVSHVELKKKRQTHRNSTVWWLEMVGEIGENGQKIQMSTYKISNLGGYIFKTK